MMKWLNVIFFLTSSLGVPAQMPLSDMQEVHGPAGSPAIRSFAFVPSASSSGQYTFTWNVSGAQNGTIFLSADCVPGTTIELHGSDTSEDTPFACGVLHSLSASHGSIDLEFSNRSSKTSTESVRLFVAGSNSVCSTMSVPVSARR
jgi:hypothetical protein